MLSESIEILQANNLHLFHQNTLLSEKVETLSNELLKMKKLLDKILKCFSKELADELESQLIATRLHLVNLENDKLIDTNTLSKIEKQLDINKDLLTKIFNGKKNLEEIIEKQIVKINNKNQKINQLKKDSKNSKDQFIKLLNQNFRYIEDNQNKIKQLEEENIDLNNKLKVNNTIEDKNNIQTDIIKCYKLTLFSDKINLLNVLGEIKISVITAIIICILLIFVTYVFIYNNKKLNFNKHKCNFCAKKHKNK